MPEHKLQPGRTLIEGLLELGRGLGYFVRPENPVRKTERNPPAVDVAWMSDENQEFPLMIFEVESSAGNTIANNPTKVFGQPTDQFEKPLFFFQAIIDSGGETSRIDCLRSLFGLNNYRLYRLDHDEKTHFFNDILSQHRRLKREIDLLALRELLKHDAWAGVDLQAVMSHAEKLQFRARYLHTYAKLALTEPEFISTFLRRVEIEERPRPLPVDHRYGYKTFLAQHFSRPIHLAVLSRAFPERGLSLFEALLNWQERTYLMPQIAPNFGLERDYDELLVCMAAGIIANIAGIFGNHLEARVYLASIVRTLLNGMARLHPRYSFYTAAWLLHMSAGLPDAQYFNSARDFINTRGGMARNWLLMPPSSVPWGEGSLPEEWPWIREILECPAQVPDLPEFREQVQATHPPLIETKGAILFAMRLLTEQGDMEPLAAQTLRLLSAPLVPSTPSAQFSV